MGKKKRHSRGKSFTLPMAVVIPLGVAGYEVAKWAAAGNIGQIGKSVTGIDQNGKFNWTALSGFWAPTAVGILVHFVAKKTGVNRILGKAGVPIIRI